MSSSDAPEERENPSTSPEGEPDLEAEGRWVRRVQELERMLVRCEGQIRGLQERVAGLETAHRGGRRRALWFRLTLLVLLLSAYAIVRSRYSN